MSWMLLANDDGVDSPALVPFADALTALVDRPVRVVVPDGERSWTGKAVTRGRPVTSRRVERGDHHVTTVDGTPADAVHLGMHTLFADDADTAVGSTHPDLVVTGVNIGFNAGDALLASSGTVGAAAEATYAGVPAIAVSTGVGSSGYADWRLTALADDDDSRRAWASVTAIAAQVVLDIAASDLMEHCDLVSVNIPWDAAPDGARTVTRLSTLRYGPLFGPAQDGAHPSLADIDIAVDDDPDHESPGEVAALLAGAVSITPVLLQRSARVPRAVRDRLER